MLYPELICRIIGFCDASTLHVLTTVCRFFGMEAQNTLFRRHIAFNPQPGPKHNPNATELSRHDAWDGMQAEERKFNALGSTRPRICQLARHGTVIGSPTLIISYASGSPLYAEALEAFSFFLFQCPNIVELTIMGMPLDEKVLYFLRNLHGLHGGGMKLTLDSCWLAHEPKLVPDAKILSFKEVVISPSPLGMASLPIFMPIGLSIFCTTSLRKIDINHQDLFRALVNSVSRHEITLPRVTDARIGFTFHAGRMTDEECSGAESRIYTLLSAAPNITSLTLDCGDHAMLFNSFATHCANMVPRLTTFKGSIYAAQNLAAPRTRPLREVTIMTSMARKNIATLYLEKILPNAAHTLRELHLTVDSDGFPYLLATLHQHRQSRIKKVSILLERTPSNRFSKMVKVPLVKASHDVLFKMQRLRHPEDIEKFATNLSEDPSPVGRDFVLCSFSYSHIIRCTTIHPEL